MPVCDGRITAGESFDRVVASANHHPNGNAQFKSLHISFDMNNKINYFRKLP